MKRKEFLQWGATACILPTLLLEESCKSVANIPYLHADGKIIIKIAEYGERKYAIVKPAKFPAPLYVSKNKNGSYSAVLLLCTHKQCELRPSPSVLVCPCHGSEFSPEGIVLSEPANKNLQRYTVTSDSENIIIQL